MSSFLEMCLFWEYVLILGKCAYFGKMYLFWGHVLILGSEGPALRNFSKIIKNESKKRLNIEKTGHLFFRNSPLPNISTFLSGQKGCAYYEWGKYFIIKKVCIL